MSGNLEVLIGVAGTGKSRRVLEEYRAALRQAHEQLRPGTTLWLVPTHRARRAVLERLVDETLLACFAPNVFTFEDFAERVLQSARQPVTPLSPVLKRMLLRRIVQDLLSAGQLRYFRAIAHTSGFLDLVEAFISELKRQETWPEHFLQAIGANAREKDRELAQIYAAYQERLLALKVYDSEGRFWSARELLARGERRPFPELSLVVADGFADFTHTQYEILRHLSEWAERIIITLPMETPLRRRDLFAKSAAALERFQQMTQNGVRVTITACDDSDVGAAPAFRALAEQLFDNPRNIQRTTDANEIELLAAIGPSGELEALAERIKRLLLAGVRPQEIIVTVRSMDDDGARIEEQLRASGVPVWRDATTVLARTSIVRALFSVLQLEAEDWRFERLMAVLGSNYFRPAWPEWQRGAALRAVGSQLRRMKLHSQRDVILRVLERRLARQAETQPANEPDATLAAACHLLKRLSEATHRLRHAGTFRHWTDVVIALGRELGIAPSVKQVKASKSTLDERDLEIWLALEKCLYEAAKAEELLTSAPRSLSLSEFAAELRDLLMSQSLLPSRAEDGCVRILDAAQARHLDIPYLFVAGLTENSFPAGRGEDCIYSESERRELNQRGLSLGHRTSHSQDEMLLFYMLVTRARRRLVLSYPAVSSQGQPLFASPYVAAVRDLFEPDSLRIRSVGRLDPIPDAEQVLTPADLRLVAVQETQQHRPQLFRRLAEEPPAAAMCRNVLAAVALAVQRFRTRGFTSCEGLLQNEQNLRALREHYSSRFEFSATQLEAYAYCPFQFFLSDVLKVQPLESPELVTDYRSRGVLVHEILATLLRETSDIRSAIGEQVSRRFRELVEQELGRRAGETDLQRALTRIEGMLLDDWSRAFAEQHEQYAGFVTEKWATPTASLRPEIPFGDVPEDGHDSKDVWFPSLVFGRDAQETRLRGRIDRIDHGQCDGQTVYTVIDYKTGRPPQFTLDEIKTGRTLQLALYTLAVKRLGIVGPEAVPYQMGYWCVRETGFVPGFKGSQKSPYDPVDAAVLQALETTLDELIPRLAEGIRSGQFVIDSQDENCTGRCAYRTVCRVNQIRPLAESLDKRRKPVQAE